jgi:hypothetical protein
MSNKRAETFHPYDAPSNLDALEADGHDYRNVHGYWPGLLIGLGVIVGSWVVAGGMVWLWVVTR